MQPNTTNTVALFGGTFDPVHYGHLKPLLALVKDFSLTKIHLMPNNQPPHKPAPQATATQRRDMLTLAIQYLPHFDIEESELNHHKPAYTIDTLIKWRNTHAQSCSLAFILGEDTLKTLDTWKHWQTLLSYCHLIVYPRPGLPDVAMSTALRNWVDVHLTHDKSLLHHKPHGHVFIANTPLYPISATLIRQRLSQGEPCDDLLPQSVLDYIKQHKLYQS